MFEFSPTSIALFVGLVLTFGANVVQYLNSRRKVVTERPKIEAETVWIGTQAADKIIENLNEQYGAAMAEVRGVRDELVALTATVEEQNSTIAALRREVKALRRRVAAFENIVKSLPTEIQARFIEVMHNNVEFGPE